MYESRGLPIQESNFSQENLEYCLSPLLFCVKIFYMKAKKIILTTTALLGAGALAFGAAKVVQEQKRLRNREEIVELVRDFFSSQGSISCLYVKLYESTDDRLVGGLVLEDDRHFAFVYENGQLSYEEEV